MKKIALLIETTRACGRNILNGVSRYAQTRRDWLMRLMTTDDMRKRRPFAGFDGIIARVTDASIAKKIRASGIPAVDTSHERIDPHLIDVGSDDECIANMAADFFLGRGFKNFAYCGFRGTKFSDNRFRAFRRRIASAGCKVHEFPLSEPMTRSFFYSENFDDERAIGHLRKWARSLPPQTAAFCANDMRAYQLIQAATLESIRIPHDIAVLGSDDDNLICLFSTPPLSSISPNSEGTGYAAARVLDAAMKDQSAALNNRHKPFCVAPGELIERASTEFHPISPAWLSDVLVFIDYNISRPISASDVVAYSGRSYPTIEKAFGKAFGETIGKYIIRTKMDVAKRLIAQGKHTCKEIAYLTGFSSPQYFCNVYRRHFGHPVNCLDGK